MAGKSPAPVLPAMGLHSFHNDSPPFAAAGLAAGDADPEMFSLDGAVSHVQNQTQNQRQNHGRQISNERPGMASRSSSTSRAAAIPITQRGFNSSLLANQHHPSIITNVGGGRVERVPASASSDDEQLSSSRSRTLISGYMFGGGPSSPSVTRPHSPSETMGNGLGIHNLGAPGRRTPTPPGPEGFDSPPLSDITGETTMQALARLAVEDREATDAVANNGETPAVPPPRKFSTRTRNSVSGGVSGQANERSSSRARDKETGYDRLNGLNDGEADLDESAPPADGFSSEEYLRTDGPRAEYQFPRHRLRTKMKDESKIPLVIVACGSFSPPTYLHLRMFEMAKDEIVESQTFEIMAGYYSPVSSYYKKSGLAPAIHRVRMCELAVEHTSTWLMVDPWEAGQSEYQRTAVVLEHFNDMLNGDGGGVIMSDGRKRKYKIMLLAGGDLIESFGEPGVWSEPDLHIILGRFGCLIVERAGSDVWAFLLSHDILYSHRRNVIVIKQLIYNDISSTKVRLFVRRGMSIKYLLPNSVIQYIYDHKLYRTSDIKAITS